jgi:hypothetical protein
MSRLTFAVILNCCRQVRLSRTIHLGRQAGAAILMSALVTHVHGMVSIKTGRH